MPTPNTLIIGASRSGTTSCYNYLKQHPEVYMSPVKEARFFSYPEQTLDFRGPADRYTINRDSVTDWPAYQRLFAERTDEPIAGEASPIYLYHPDTAATIHRYVPDCTLLCILRNPIDRGYSDFLNMVRLGWEPLRDYEEALRREDDRTAKHWGPFYHYGSKGHYASQLQRYLDVFDREQLHIYLFDDFVSDPVGVMQDMYGRLGIDTTFRPKTETAHNRSGLPKSDLLHAVLTHPVAEKTFRGPLRDLRQHWRDQNTRHEKEPLPVALRHRLRERYRDDIERLSEQIDRDVSHWLTA